MKREIDDRVKVREDLVTGKSYSSVIFVQEMEQFRGKFLTIREVLDGNYSVKENQFYWSDEMFEEFPEEQMPTLWKILSKKIDDLDKRLRAYEEKNSESDPSINLGHVTDFTTSQSPGCIDSPFKSHDPNFVALNTNEKQFLTYQCGQYGVIPTDWSSSKPIEVCKIPTPREQLEIGKFYVATDQDLDEDIHKIDRYKLYLGRGRYVYYDNSDTSFFKGYRENSMRWDNWHEVRLKE